MKSSIKGLLAAVLTVGLGLSSIPAFAQGAGFYAGGAIGQAKLKDACTPEPGLVINSCDNKDTAWKIFGGYQFNANFGAELGYVDLGKGTVTGTILGIPFTGSRKAKAFELVGVGTIPLADKFSAYGKLGFARWDADASATVGGFSASASENGTDLTYAIGLKYDITKTIGARLEWQRYKDIGKEATTGKSDVDLLSVGVVFKF